MRVNLAGSDFRGHSSATTTLSLWQAVYWSGLRRELDE